MWLKKSEERGIYNCLFGLISWNAGILPAELNACQQDAGVPTASFAIMSFKISSGIKIALFSILIRRSKIILAIRIFKVS
jgi:hypothetical protein